LADSEGEGEGEGGIDDGKKVIKMEDPVVVQIQTMKSIIKLKLLRKKD